MSHPIIALWSHPRSMSTAFERIMRSRGDFECMHEPFMYDYYVNRSAKQMPHFNAMDGHPRNYAAIRDMILTKSEAGPVFFKDMSYYVVPHILEDGSFLERVTHSFLIRDPKASILSYAKLDSDILLEEIGLEAQWRLAEGVMSRTGRPPLVVRSEAVQARPEEEMRKYWSALGLPDKPDALRWEDPPPSDWNQVQAWHCQVMSSTTIRPPDPAREARTAQEFKTLEDEHPRFGSYLAHHLPYYSQLLSFAS